MLPRRTTALLGGALPLVATALLSTTSPATAAVAYSASDPTTWTNAQLAAQVTFGCVDAADAAGMKAQARAGYGGTTLLGTDANRNLPTYLRDARAVAAHGVVPFVASDEEGGRVQRLSKLIYPLPSAKYMGTYWSTDRIRRTSADYGTRMRRLGVQMDFAPVADLAIPGYYMDSLGRAFNRDPYQVAADVRAWSAGMRSVGVVPVVKHWPGHGQATNTHTGASSVPPLSTLEKRDMIPFNDQWRFGAPAVMVGHLTSQGLTDPGLPATESPKALAYLRARTGPGTVIVTDSLSMAAASSAIHRTVPVAAVWALKSGADVALACESTGVVSGITGAMNRGFLSRASVLVKVERILKLKSKTGLGPQPKPLPTPSPSPTAKPTVSPTTAPTVSPTATSSASAGPAATPDPTATATATTDPTATTGPTATTDPTGGATPTP